MSGDTLYWEMLRTLCQLEWLMLQNGCPPEGMFSKAQEEIFTNNSGQISYIVALRYLVEELP